MLRWSWTLSLTPSCMRPVKSSLRLCVLLCACRSVLVSAPCGLLRISPCCASAVVAVSHCGFHLLCDSALRVRAAAGHLSAQGEQTHAASDRIRRAQIGTIVATPLCRTVPCLPQFPVRLLL